MDFDINPTSKTNVDYVLGGHSNSAIVPDASKTCESSLPLARGVNFIVPVVNFPYSSKPLPTTIWHGGPERPLRMTILWLLFSPKVSSLEQR